MPLSPTTTRRGALVSGAGLAAGWAFLRARRPAPTVCPPSGPTPGLPDESARLARLTEALDRRADDRELAVLDLDALEHNLSRVRAQVGPALALRLVTKSLPSVALVRHLMDRARTSRVMVFSENMLLGLLEGADEDLDVLTGRPFGPGAVRRVIARSSATKPAAQIRWLVDDLDRITALDAVAAGEGWRLRLAVELDVGLRRGGARTPTELMPMLDAIAASPRLEFAGFMGYDGHVPFAPPGFSADDEHRSVLRRYAEFVGAAQARHPRLFDASVVCNSGGSRTYERYGSATAPVDEVALGSALLYPHRFRNLTDTELRPASFLASPILKVVAPAEVPFVSGVLGLGAPLEPRLEAAYFLQGGDFPAERITPENWTRNPLVPSPDGVQNLIPNQSQWLGPRSAHLQTGQYVLFHPWEGDGLAWLDEIQVFRGDRFETVWTTSKRARA